MTNGNVFYAGLSFPARVRILVNREIPRWIETAKGLNRPDIVFVLETQRSRLLMGDVTAAEVEQDVGRARRILHAELEFRIMTDSDDDDTI